jgi:uncharacterized membrane protein YeiH
MSVLTPLSVALPPTIDPLLRYLDLAGLGVFALSGAVAAAAKRQSLVTFIFFAIVTGVGGGTVRDLLIGAPVFWIHENAILLICIAAATLVWVLPARIWDGTALLWLDAVGLAAYSAYGASKGLDFGIAPLPAVMMGVITGCVGGIIRAVLAGEPSTLMRHELYVTAAGLSAALMVLLDYLGLSGLTGVLIAAAAGFVLRGGAIRYGWAIPAYRKTRNRPT